MNLKSGNFQVMDNDVLNEISLDWSESGQPQPKYIVLTLKGLLLVPQAQKKYKPEGDVPHRVWHILLRLFCTILSQSLTFLDLMIIKG